MGTKTKFEIKEVSKNSIGEEMGIQAGDFLVSVNNKDVVDILDYLMVTSSLSFSLGIECKNTHKISTLEIERDFDEEMGLSFCNELLSENKQCKNSCIFCFIDQLPLNMRQSLYFKDDDWRMSFLAGNYITLTNLNDNDFDRIIKDNISPLYISVHSTNPEIRTKLLRNKKAALINKQLKLLTDAGIELHCQTVVVPDYNDGDELTNTIDTLYNLSSNIKSLAVVPVGLTEHREGLTPIKPVDKTIAKDIINRVDIWKKENNVNNFVFVSDEVYIRAGMDIPTAESYFNFDQIEDGVGLIAKFRYNIEKDLETLSDKQKQKFKNKTISIVTGISGYNHTKDMCNKLEKQLECNFNVYAVENNFFGKSVTVSGLLTAGDIISQLKDKNTGDLLVISDFMLKGRDSNGVFLDDKSIKEISKNLNIKIHVSDGYGYEYLSNILNNITE